MKLKKSFKVIISIALAVIITSISYYEDNQDNKDISTDKIIEFPANRYPETAQHIRNSIENGKSEICTIDRAGAAENRSKSLRDVPTKKGYDRDEYPMAFCEEGGYGADIEYILPSDNRGAGSWISHQVDELEDGMTFKIEVID